MSTADEIAKRHDLLAEGAITQAEFERAWTRLLAQPPGGTLAINRPRRSDRDEWIAGVCGGIGAATGAASWVRRLVFVLGPLFGGVTRAALSAAVDLRAEGRRVVPRGYKGNDHPCPGISTSS